MKEMFIPCATPEEKQEVIKHLVSIGYRDFDTKGSFLFVATHPDGDIQSVVDNKHLQFPTITPQQLLNKQETTTMNKLKQAVENSGLSKSELSRRLGKSRNYIGEILRVGCTTAKQNELIEMIDQVKSGEVFKSDADIIAELSEKLAQAQDSSQHNANCAHKYLEQAKTADASVKRLTAELEKKHSLLVKQNKTIEATDGYVSKVAAERDNLTAEHNKLNELLSNHEKQNKALQAKYDELEAFNIDVGKLLKAEQSKTALLEEELTKAGDELLDQDEKINGMAKDYAELSFQKKILDWVCVGLMILSMSLFVYLLSVV
jgi:transcriptional regulator with XRE-family HTH domain